MKNLYFPSSDVIVDYKVNWFWVEIWTMSEVGQETINLDV